MTVIVDGGLSTSLTEQGYDLSHDLWTARLIAEEPAALVRAHRAFLDAGAEVLITSSYQASIDGFERNGATTAEAAALLQSTTAIARQAVAEWSTTEMENRDGSRIPMTESTASLGDEFDEDRTSKVERSAATGPSERLRSGPNLQRSIIVAASVGPYGAVLADGSEYRGEYALSNGELVVFHRDRVRLLAETEPDWWACETIPTASEAVAMGLALSAVRKLPTWMTFNCRSGSYTFGGDRIEDAVTAALSACDLTAVGVNCTAPGFVPELLGRIRQVTDLPLVAYPNSGQTWDAPNRVWMGDPGATDVTAWIAAGAEYVGGCCGVGPTELAHLAALARR
jgi:homocysteine S-methyltransferase